MDGQQDLAAALLASAAHYAAGADATEKEIDDALDQVHATYERAKELVSGQGQPQRQGQPPEQPREQPKEERRRPRR